MNKRKRAETTVKIPTEAHIYLKILFNDIIEKLPCGRQRCIKQDPLMKGPFLLSLDESYTSFLEKLSEWAEVEPLDTSRLLFKFNKPANSEQLPLNSDIGYKSMIEQVQSLIRIRKNLDPHITVFLHKTTEVTQVCISIFLFSFNLLIIYNRHQLLHVFL